MAEEKRIYDARGRMSNLGRLKHFDREALVHLISYRLLIITSLLTFITFLISLAAPSADIVWKVLLLFVWIFFSTQVFETLKGLSLTGSGGIAFGRLNESFISAMVTKKTSPGFKAIPYVALAFWLAGLVAYIVELVI